MSWSEPLGNRSFSLASCTRTLTGVAVRFRKLSGTFALRAVSVTRRPVVETLRCSSSAASVTTREVGLGGAGRVVGAEREVERVLTAQHVLGLGPEGAAEPGELGLDLVVAGGGDREPRRVVRRERVRHGDAVARRLGHGREQVVEGDRLHVGVARDTVDEIGRGRDVGLPPVGCREHDAGGRVALERERPRAPASRRWVRSAGETSVSRRSSYRGLVATARSVPSPAARTNGFSVSAGETFATDGAADRDPIDEEIAHAGERGRVDGIDEGRARAGRHLRQLFEHLGAGAQLVGELRPEPGRLERGEIDRDVRRGEQLRGRARDRGLDASDSGREARVRSARARSTTRASRDRPER